MEWNMEEYGMEKKGSVELLMNGEFILTSILGHITSHSLQKWTVNSSISALGSASMQWPMHYTIVRQYMQHEAIHCVIYDYMDDMDIITWWSACNENTKLSELKSIADPHLFAVYHYLQHIANVIFEEICFLGAFWR